MAATGKATALAVAIVATLATAACGGKDPGTMNTMTQQQATHRVESYVRNAVAALPEHVQLHAFAKDSGSCDDPSDNGPKGRVEPSVTYKVTGLDASKYNMYFDDLRSWWTHHQFQVLKDDRPQDLYLWVENKNDAFRMAAQANDLGELYLTATSTCVWPNGTPPASVTG